MSEEKLVKTAAEEERDRAEKAARAVAESEAQSREDVKDFMALAKEWGQPALAAVVIVAVASFGFTMWKNHKAGVAAAESAALSQASEPDEYARIAATAKQDGTAQVALAFAAQGYARTGRWDEALSAYKELEARFPDDDLGSTAGLGVASCLEALGEREAAAAAYDAWLAAHKGHAQEALATVDAVRCHKDAGQFAEARVLAEDFLVAHPDDDVARARLEDALKSVAQAERAAAEAAEAAPEEPAAEEEEATSESEE